MWIRRTGQRALQELYNDCSSLYPVEGCAPGKATREQLEAAYGKDFLYQDAVNHTFPEALVEALSPRRTCRSRPRRI